MFIQSASDLGRSSTIGYICVNYDSSQVSLKFSTGGQYSREVKSKLVTLGQMLPLSGRFIPLFSHLLRGV